MKKTFIEFLVEKKAKKIPRDYEDKFKDVDCTCKNLTDEEKEYCASKDLIDFLTVSNAGNN